MKLLISLYFFILAIIQAGLLLGVFFYYRAKLTVRPGQFGIPLNIGVQELNPISLVLQII